MMRAATLVGAIAFVAASIIVGVRNSSERAREKQQEQLVGLARDHASALDSYFARSREINLLAAQNPAFREFVDLDGALSTKVRANGSEIRKVNEALAYLEKLYPGQIGEACFIDKSGAESARVVHGKHAHVHELSPDESKNPFFAPTFALPTGEVHQARPYVSPDTNEWVISNSTPISSGDGHKHAIVHFEVTLESFRRSLASSANGVVVRIADRSSGRVILDSRYAQSGKQPLGRPKDTELVPVVAGRPIAGVSTRDSTRFAYHPVGGKKGNANEWVVVASSPIATGFSLSTIGLDAILLILAALAMLLLAALGMRGYQRQLRTAAETDALTGLGNRTQFAERVHHALAAGRREARLSAVVLIDLDRFKDVNDALGHAAGDTLLREVGQRLTAATRRHDSIARLGGDEFAVLLAQSESRETVLVTVRRLLSQLDEPFRISDVSLVVRASAGIALAPEHGTSSDELLKHADIAMYESKRSKDGVTFYHDDLDTFGAERLALVSDLRRALERNELTLAFQPKVDLRSGAIDGVEALVRWDHPSRGPLLPGDFVPLAETVGLTKDLTSCVITLALIQCRRWLDEGLELQVAVNLSPRCIQDAEIVELTRRELARLRVPARLLKFEITEGSLVGDTERAVDLMAELADMGVTLSVDDYGTGYSSLSYLKDLPIHELKIDRSFLTDPAEEASRRIVRSTVELGHQLGLRIVAEGVEHPEAIRELLAIGCDSAQGYYFSEPMPADGLIEWLRERNPSRRETPTPIG